MGNWGWRRNVPLLRNADDDDGKSSRTRWFTLNFVDGQQKTKKIAKSRQ
jgi:hypothetical protein